MTTTARLTHLRRAARTAPARAQARRAAAQARQETAATAAVSARRPRRLGRQRGPQRVQMSTRLLLEDDVRLTAALEQTGLHLQEGVQEALRLWFKKLRIPKLPVPSATGTAIEVGPVGSNGSDGS